MAYLYQQLAHLFIWLQHLDLWNIRIAQLPYLVWQAVAFNVTWLFDKMSFPII